MGHAGALRPRTDRPAARPCTGPLGGTAQAAPQRAHPHPPLCHTAAQAINYTSGTTGQPKGVLYHHRGAALNAINNALIWGLEMHPTYLWTLPMFHCNGWCFPYTITMQAGVHVCLRTTDAPSIFSAIGSQSVSHLCGAPVVMNLMLHASADEHACLEQRGGSSVAGLVSGIMPSFDS